VFPDEADMPHQDQEQEPAQDLLDHLERLCHALQVAGDALAGSHLDQLLEAEPALADALGRWPAPGALPVPADADQEAVRRALGRTRVELIRCRRLGATLVDLIRLSLASHAEGDYTRAGHERAPVRSPGLEASV
jgi:hypothetical protein